MINKNFELERLKSTLRSRGLDEDTVIAITNKADQEIESIMAERMIAAMESAIAVGVDKNSPEFINDIRPMPGAFQLEVSSGITDFSVPPFPMLPKLLQGAKPMKDGSGVYKIIPVGTPGKKPGIASNIFDAQKALSAERLELAKRQYNKVTPSGSKTTFRTATSKQSQLTNWVHPGEQKDFTQDLNDINAGLEQDLQEAIMNVIREYEENF